MIRDLSKDPKDWVYLVGKTVRMQSMFTIGIVAGIRPIKECDYYSEYVYLVLNNGREVNVQHIKCIMDNSIILREI